MEMPHAERFRRIERLKAIRKRLRWSEELCAHHVGVTYSTLNRWERGQSAPTSRAVLNAIDRFIAQHSAGRTKRKGRNPAKGRT